MRANIPMEIQMEIVRRVPVKSLFQFRSVSKSWKSLIDSPQFVADYNACESRPHNLLIRYEDLQYPEYEFESDPKYVCIVDDDSFPQNKLSTPGPMNLEYPDVLSLVGSSKGLLCLLGEYKEAYQEKAFIWNPAIRKSIALEWDLDINNEIYPTILGFGVHPDTNEPVLVRIHDKDFPFRVEVYTLSSKKWRWLHSNLPRRSIAFLQSQVAIDGLIYWHTFNGLIVSFNMTTEEFVEINLPCCLAFTRTKSFSVSKLRGSLAVLEHYKEAEKPVCAVWIMEHGVSKSFTKLFTVTSPNAFLMDVLGFRMNGEPVLEVMKDKRYRPAVLEVYEPHSENNKDIGISGEYGSFFISSYTETLLLLDQPDTNV